MLEIMIFFTYLYIFKLINHMMFIMKSTASLQHFGFSLPQLSAVRRKRFPRQNPSEVLNAEIPAATWSDYRNQTYNP